MLPGCPNHWEQHQQKFSALFEEKVVSSARPNSTRGLHKRKNELRNETSDKEGGGAQENIPMPPPCVFLWQNLRFAAVGSPVPKGVDGPSLLTRKNFAFFCFFLLFFCFF